MLVLESKLSILSLSVSVCGMFLPQRGPAAFHLSRLIPWAHPIHHNRAVALGSALTQVYHDKGTCKSPTQGSLDSLEGVTRAEVAVTDLGCGQTNHV